MARTRASCPEVGAVFLICGKAVDAGVGLAGTGPGAQSPASGHCEVNGFVKELWEMLFHFQKGGK